MNFAAKLEMKEKPTKGMMTKGIENLTNDLRIFTFIFALQLLLFELCHSSHSRNQSSISLFLSDLMIKQENQKHA